MVHSHIPDHRCLNTYLYSSVRRWATTAHLSIRVFLSNPLISAAILQIRNKTMYTVINDLIFPNHIDYVPMRFRGVLKRI